MQFHAKLTLTQTKVTPMPTARFSMSVAAVNNKLYVCGGQNGGVLGIVEVSS